MTKMTMIVVIMADVGILLTFHRLRWPRITSLVSPPTLDSDELTTILAFGSPAGRVGKDV